jgi:hypothetical protein
VSELMRRARAAAAQAAHDGKASDLGLGTYAACRHFQAAAGNAPDSQCAQYDVPTSGAYANGCRDGWTPADPAIRALEARRRKVADLLGGDPALKYSCDVEGASPIGPARAPVSVVLGLRDSLGTIIVGEFSVPADRWDMAAFICYWDEQAGKRAS